jgi:hypothetical protein
VVRAPRVHKPVGAMRRQSAASLHVLASLLDELLAPHTRDPEKFRVKAHTQPLADDVLGAWGIAGVGPRIGHALGEISVMLPTAGCLARLS